MDAAEEVNSVEFVRVEYAVERAAEGISHSTLPDEFAEQIRVGGNSQLVEATYQTEGLGWPLAKTRVLFRHLELGEKSDSRGVFEGG